MTLGSTDSRAAEAIDHVFAAADALSVWNAIRVVISQAINAAEVSVYVHDQYTSGNPLRLEQASRKRQGSRKGSFRLGNPVGSSHIAALAMRQPEVVHEQLGSVATEVGDSGCSLAFSLPNPADAKSRLRPLGVIVAETSSDDVNRLRSSIESLRNSDLCRSLEFFALEATLARRMDSRDDLPDPDRAIEAVLETLCRSLGFAYSQLFLVDEYRGQTPEGQPLPLQIRMTRGRGVPVALTGATRLSVESDTAVARVWRTGFSETDRIKVVILESGRGKENDISEWTRIFMPFGSVGTIEVGLESEEDVTVDPKVLKVVQRWLSQASVAIQKARLYARTDQRREAISYLREFNQELEELQSTRNTDLILERIAEGAQRVFQADLVLLYWTELREATGARSAELEGPIEKGDLRGTSILSAPNDANNIVNHIAQTRRAYLQPNARDDERLARSYRVEQLASSRLRPRSFLERQRIESFSGIPLVRRGDLLGVLCLNFREHRAFSRYDQDLFELFAEEAAEALDSNETSVELAVAQERRRLARDMHDDVKTNLRTIALNAERAIRQFGVTPESVLVELQDIVEISWAAMDEIERILDNLDFGADELTLDDIIERELSTRFGAARARIDTAIEPGLPTLQRKVAGAVRRVLREAVINSLKYADASRIDVTARLDSGEKMLLEVHDDGVGFNTNAEFGSHKKGLRIMRERIAEIRGSVELYSEPANGTRVLVWVPLK